VAHVLALGHSVGDALAVDSEFMVELLQPKVNIDRFRAEHGTAGAVVSSMVAKGVARSNQGSGRRHWACGRSRTGVVLIPSRS
jgi:hypothetical protein